MSPADRRQATVWLPIALVASLLLWVPARAQDAAAHLHQEGQVSGPIVESEQAQKVSSVIQCFCGGCANQTIHDCTCGFAAAERAKIASALEAGATPESLIAQYVAEHGPQIRIVPERSGLNLIGWSIPWIVAAISLIALGVVLLGWSRRGAHAPADAAKPLSPEDQRWRDRIEKELKEMES